MDEIELRRWAESTNEKYEGAFTQYLIGNEGIVRPLVDLVNTLGENLDLYWLLQALNEIIDDVEAHETNDAIANLLKVQAKLKLELKSKPNRLVSQPPPPTVTPTASTPGLLPDTEIRALASSQGMITPFKDEQVTRDKAKLTISYGLSSCGYDVRVGSTFKVFTNAHGLVIDPKNFDERNFVSVEAQDGYLILPARGYALGLSMEKFKIPRDVTVTCEGKSTYARCGIAVNVTPMEPEWEGQATLTFLNLSPAPVKLYAGEGVAQFMFWRSTSPCGVSYKDRGGKYQGASDIMPAKMKI